MNFHDSNKWIWEIGRMMTEAHKSGRLNVLDFKVLNKHKTVTVLDFENISI